MKISVTFRNAEGENWQKEYVEERLEKLKKYIDNPVDALVTANPGCHLQLAWGVRELGMKQPVLHLEELLGRSLPA